MFCFVCRGLCHCQLPSGLLSDLVGRRATLLLSSFFHFSSLLGLIATDWLLVHSSIQSRLLCFILSALLEGCAQSLASGGDVALMHDSMDALAVAMDSEERCDSEVEKEAEEFKGQLSSSTDETTTRRLSSPNSRRKSEDASSSSSVPKSPTASDAEVARRLALRSTLWPAATACGNLFGGVLFERGGGIRACMWLSLLCAAVAMPVAAALEEAQSRKHQFVESAPPHSTRHDPSNQPPSPLSYSSQPLRSNLQPISVLSSHLRSSLHSILSRPSLQLLILLHASFHVTSEPLHRFRSFFLREHGVEATSMGTIGAGMYGMSSLGAYCMAKGMGGAGGCEAKEKEEKTERNEERTSINISLPIPSMTNLLGIRMVHLSLSHTHVLLACSLLPPLLNIMATCTHGTVAALFLLPTSLLYGVRMPLLAHMFHRQLHHEPTQRATVASCSSLINKLVLAISLPCVAAVTDAYGIDATMRIFAVLAIFPLLFIWMQRELSDQSQHDVALRIHHLEQPAAAASLATNSLHDE